MGAATILLADNNRRHLKTFSELLDAAGFSVTEAPSYAKVREILEKEKTTFDLAVLDLRLKSDKDDKDWSGLELAEQYSNDSFPFVIISASADIKAVTRSLERDGFRNPPAVAFVVKSDGPDALLRAVKKAFMPRIFLTHGHDTDARSAVEGLLKEVGLRGIVLQDEAGGGQPIIQKFEEHSRAHFAIVLITPDDLGGKREDPPVLRPRARQNVIFELGFFLGKLGRDRVIAMYKEEKERIELPSNYEGVQYISLDSGGNWRSSLVRELKRAGIQLRY